MRIYRFHGNYALKVNLLCHIMTDCSTDASWKADIKYSFTCTGGGCNRRMWLLFHPHIKRGNSDVKVKGMAHCELAIRTGACIVWWHNRTWCMMELRSGRGGGGRPNNCWRGDIQLPRTSKASRAPQLLARPLSMWIVSSGLASAHDLWLTCTRPANRPCNQPNRRPTYMPTGGK